MYYGKIFEDIFDSSLMADGGWLPTYLFMSLISMADKEGFVRKDARVLYRRLGFGEENRVSFDEFNSALGLLEATDELSNLPTENGRRIIPLSRLEDEEGDRGWFIVNYSHYREKGGSIELRRKQDATRKRRQREKKCHVTVTASHGESAHTDTDTDTDTDIKNTATTSENEVSATGVPFQAIVNKWDVMAARVGIPQVAKLTTTLKGQIRQRWKDDLKALKNWDNFFAYIENNEFLSGRAQPGPGRSKPMRATLLWVTKEGNFAKIAAKEFS